MHAETKKDIYEIKGLLWGLLLLTAIGFMSLTKIASVGGFVFFCGLGIFACGVFAQVLGYWSLWLKALTGKV